MSISSIKHSDNITVKNGRQYKDGSYSSHEYLAVCFRDEEEYAPYRVSLYRYCVPGRCDTYSFDYAHGVSGPSRIRFFADRGNENLPKALKLLHEDLEKPQVIQMLVEACKKPELRRYADELVNDLLFQLAPRSKAYRACLKAYDKVMADVRAQIDANRAARLVKSATDVTTS